MTKEDKGILGEKYVSQKIEEAIKYWGKDIKLFGPIILKYYSIYGEMTCEIDHVIVLGNKVILGETKNGYYENIDYEAECWKILYGNDITDNPVIQNHYHKEVFCSMLGIELQKVITVEFLLNYENCKIRTQYPNDYVLGKDNIYDYLLLLFSDYSDSTENDNSELCKKLQVYQSAYGKMKDNHIKRLNEVYNNYEALYENEYNSRYFKWLEVNAPEKSVYIYERGRDDHRIIVALNFSDNEYAPFTFKVEEELRLREIVNSDSDIYGGSTWGMRSDVTTTKEDDYLYNLSINLKPFSGIIYEVVND